MCSWTAALRCASREFIIPCCWQDIPVLDKLNKTLESIDVALPPSTRLPRTYAENKNTCSCPRLRENNQGSFSGVVDTFHSSALTQTYVDGCFPRVDGSPYVIQVLGGEGSQTYCCIFWNHLIFGKARETRTILALSDGNWNLGG